MTTTTPVVTSVLLQALLEHEVTVITVVVWAVVVVKWAVGVVSVSVSGADDSGTLDSELMILEWFLEQKTLG